MIVLNLVLVYKKQIDITVIGQCVLHYITFIFIDWILRNIL